MARTQLTAFQELEKAYQELKATPTSLCRQRSFRLLASSSPERREINNPLAFVMNNLILLRRDFEG